MSLAPIVLFVYDRPSHTRLTIEALQRNSLSPESELYIYSDGPKRRDDIEKILEVRDYLKSVDGFKTISVIEHQRNLGLANSIISGVGEIIGAHGKVIVMEDDLVTSPFFLQFMNDALNHYKNEEHVWHISGWNYPISAEGLGDTYLWRAMNCWGWATWADKWQHFEKNAHQTINEFSKKDIKRFDLNGNTDFFRQVRENKANRLNTWAIFWYVTIFRHEGLCVNPTQTFVENIGQDGSGTHCSTNNTITDKLSLKSKVIFDDDINENTVAVRRIERFLRRQKRGIVTRLTSKFLKKQGQTRDMM